MNFIMFVFAMISAMTLSGCCDSCLFGNKKKNIKTIEAPKQKFGILNMEKKDPTLAGFKKTNDDKFWIYKEVLCYFAKNGKLSNNEFLFNFILEKYLGSFECNGDIVIDGNIRYAAILLGDTGVGKTQIIANEVKGVFDELHIATIGVELNDKCFEVCNKKYKLKIIDISGQEKYRSICLNFLKSCDIIILVFDVINRQSFENLDSWYNEIKNKPLEGAAIFVVGNKCDLQEQKAVEDMEVNDWIENLGKSK